MKASTKIALISAGALIVAIPAITFAHGMGMKMGGKFTKPAAVGTVSAINGNTITLSGKNGTTYTVDASKATITKVSQGSSGGKPTQSSITISGIANGDTLMVQGTASGNNVTATKIIDGAFGMGRGWMGNRGNSVFGTVSDINGNTITVTGRNNTTYTVDVTNATISKITPGANGSRPTKTTISVSGIAKGDTIMASGDLSGTNLTAKNVIDGVFSGKGGFHRGGMMGMKFGSGK